jgi:Lar family restriction alleviation protein
MEQLKKCPFCGGEAFIPKNEDGEWCTWVVCRECNAETSYFETLEEAIAAWNTRKPMERIVERLEEEMKWHSDKAKEELEEFCLEMFHHHSDEALGFEKAIEIVKEEMS